MHRQYGGTSARGVVILLCIASAACEMVTFIQFPAVFDANGNRQCAIGQPDVVHLSTNTATLECLRLCLNNPECVVFNLYDNATCEIFTCSFLYSRHYQVVEFCKSFRVGISLAKFASYWNYILHSFICLFICWNLGVYV